jgi:hypothetical protein
MVWKLFIEDKIYVVEYEGKRNGMSTLKDIKVVEEYARLHL